MKQILICFGILFILAGLLIFGRAINAMNEIVSAIVLMGGFILVGIGTLMHTIDAACDRLIKAIWTPPAKEDGDQAG